MAQHRNSHHNLGNQSLFNPVVGQITTASSATFHLCVNLSNRVWHQHHEGGPEHGTPSVTFHLCQDCLLEYVSHFTEVPFKEIGTNESFTPITPLQCEYSFRWPWKVKKSGAFFISWYYRVNEFISLQQPVPSALSPQSSVPQWGKHGQSWKWAMKSMTIHWIFPNLVKLITFSILTHHTLYMFILFTNLWQITFN